MPRFVDDVHSDSGRGGVREIEMYVLGPDDQPVEPLPYLPHRTIAQTLEAWRAALAAVQEHARVINSPGGFVTPQVDFPTLTGFREDVQVTLHADARRASELAVDGGVLADDIAGLRVDEASLRTHRTELSWDATLRTGPCRRRAARLRLTPSPSFNVTVIRLTPVKSQRVATRAFIRSGLRASFELVDRLEHRLLVD